MEMNFYRHIRRLDHEVIGSKLVSIPTGRAYNGNRGLYADKIHIAPFSEKPQKLNDIAFGGLYMGTAGLMNLAYLAQIRPRYAVFFDVNPFQTVYNNVLLSIIRANETYDGFRQSANYAEDMAKRVISRKLAGVEFSSVGSWTSMISHDDGMSLSRRSFVGSAMLVSATLDQIGYTQSDYALIKEMADHNRVGTLTLDVFDEIAWQQLAQSLGGILNDPRMPLTFYFSSILNFARRESDWTGRPLNGANLSGFLSCFPVRDAVIVDNRGQYNGNEFQNLMKEEKPWLLPHPTKTIKVSVPVFGAAPLVQPSI